MFLGTAANFPLTCLVFHQGRGFLSVPRKTPQRRGESPQRRGESPQLRGESPQRRVESPQIRVESPQIRVESPQIRGKSPPIRGESPQIRGGSQQICSSARGESPPMKPGLLAVSTCSTWRLAKRTSQGTTPLKTKLRQGQQCFALELPLPELVQKRGRCACGCRGAHDFGAIRAPAICRQGTRTRAVGGDALTGRTRRAHAQAGCTHKAHAQRVPFQRRNAPLSMRTPPDVPTTTQRNVRAHARVLHARTIAKGN